MSSANPDSGAVKVDRKAKAKLPPQEVPIRPPEARVQDFAAVKLSFDEQSAMAEAERCLLCPKEACVVACPFHNDIPSAMQLIAEGKFLDAAAIYQETSTMPDICSRVCPQDNLCEGACVLDKRGQGVALGALERFVTDYARVHGPGVERPPSTGKRVAVVGAGPAGLSVAQRLLEKGHAVTLYDALPSAGGWLTYAIPTYKLPREIVHDKITFLEKLGAEFVYNTRIGEDIPLQKLRDDFDAVFLGVGAMIDAKVRIEGRKLPGVYAGTNFLLPVYVPDHLRPPDMMELPQVGRRVAVFGGGDTAMDCVRTAVRLQTQQGWKPDVRLIYRRTDQEMPASHKERELAIEEGVEFIYLEAPTEFFAGPDGKLQSVEIQRMELGEPDDSGRRRPVPIEGDTYTLEIDTAVLALGYWPDPLMSEHEPELETKKWGEIAVDEETGATNLEGVYSGGDAVRGPFLVSHAAHDGILAANAIHEYLMA
ncbi:MAG: NAD(P)-dependent oxidoreductase [Chloroflexi bacterium]|nr:NAD(P)-dependent oxidoreductase [Chloroflexota bacterium]